VNAPNLYFFVAIGIVFCVLVFIAGYCYWRHRRSSPATFESLFAQLKWIDRNNIAQVALDLVDLSGRPKVDEAAATIESSQLWDLIGGLDGLETMERNSEVIIALAFYLQQWYPEALPVAERLRLDARELKWHVGRLRGAAQKGNLQISFPFYAQRAVATYYLMTRRVLDLYEAANFSMLTDLQRAL
jgi:hypothetical protein